MRHVSTNQIQQGFQKIETEIHSCLFYTEERLVCA